MPRSSPRPGHPSSDLDSVGRELFYVGRVQGVGFRQTTWTVAQQFVVSGYVENLPDGRVHVEVEGPRPEVDKFLQEVERNLGQFIREIQAAEQAPRGQWHDFTIRH